MSIPGFPLDVMVLIWIVTKTWNFFWFSSKKLQKDQFFYIDASTSDKCFDYRFLGVDDSHAQETYTFVAFWV